MKCCPGSVTDHQLFICTSPQAALDSALRAVAQLDFDIPAGVNFGKLGVLSCTFSPYAHLVIAERHDMVVIYFW